MDHLGFTGTARALLFRPILAREAVMHGHRTILPLWQFVAAALSSLLMLQLLLIALHEPQWKSTFATLDINHKVQVLEHFQLNREFLSSQATSDEFLTIKPEDVVRISVDIGGSDAVAMSNYFYAQGNDQLGAAFEEAITQLRFYQLLAALALIAAYPVVIFIVGYLFAYFAKVKGLPLRRTATLYAYIVSGWVMIISMLQLPLAPYSSLYEPGSVAFNFFLVLFCVALAHHSWFFSKTHGHSLSVVFLLNLLSLFTFCVLLVGLAVVLVFFYARLGFFPYVIS